MRRKGRGPVTLAQAHVNESMQGFLQVKLEEEAEEPAKEGAGLLEATKTRRDRKEDEESATETLAGEELLKALNDILECYPTEEEHLQEEKHLSTRLVEARIQGIWRSLRPRQPLQA